MALTDVRKVQEAVWVRCPIPDYNDEEHLILPYIRDAARAVVEDAQVQEWKNNEITKEFDRNLFDSSYLKTVWKGWRGIPDVDRPGQRLDGPGIVHKDGRVENPALCTEENKMILLNARPGTFYIWLQTAANDLAMAKNATNNAQRAAFREADEVPAGESQAELRGMPDALSGEGAA